MKRKKPRFVPTDDETPGTVSAIESPAAVELCASMDELGCVFEFALCDLKEATSSAVEHHHRAAVRVLFNALRLKQTAHWNAVVARDPKYSAQQPEPLNFYVDQASARPLDADAVVSKDRFPAGHRFTSHVQ